MISKPLGQRQTRQREVILQVIATSNGPLSIQQILKLSQKKGGIVAIATVYRTVNLLMEAKQIQSVNLPNGETRYESADLGHHHHFQCRKCRNVFDLSICPVHLARGTIIPGGFVVEDHEMTLYGLCPKCAEKSKPI